MKIYNRTFFFIIFGFLIVSRFITFDMSKSKSNVVTEPNSALIMVTFLVPLMISLGIITYIINSANWYCHGVMSKHTGRVGKFLKYSKGAVQTFKHFQKCLHDNF